jgi:hypothetical protein
VRWDHGYGHGATFTVNAKDGNGNGKRPAVAPLVFDQPPGRVGGTGSVSTLQVGSSAPQASSVLPE